MNEGAYVSSNSDLADSFSALRKVWSTRHPRRANGGWWALSGFAIQTTVALERFVRAILIEERSAVAEIESLSDFLIAEEKLSLTQVKRTLTAATLGSALREAYEIASICSPGLASQIEFQVVCEHCDPGLSVTDLSADRIFPDGETYDATRLALVRRLFVADQPICVMSNPGLSLRRTLLIGGVRDADQVARAALGEIFDAFDGRNRDNIQTALYRALSNIRAAANIERRSPGRLLAPDCFVRRATGANMLFTRARPRLDDLVANRFRERSEQLATLVAAAHLWLSGLHDAYAADDRKLPVFWLDGRPGDGKSILTLQLIEALVTSGRLASVTELSDVDELKGWLKTCSRWAASDAEQAEIGFLDDLPARTDRNGLDKLVDDAYYRGTPYVGLITCGTADAYQTFSAGDQIAITRVAIPQPTDAEYEVFRQWAEAKLGRPISAPNLDGRSLAAFMSTLADELTGTSDDVSAVSDSFEEIQAAVAANGLGFAAPIELLKEDSVAHFARSLTTIELTPETERDGVRLAHAEVIWPLYVRKVGSAQLGTILGRDLARVLAAHLQAGRKIAARGLLGSLLNRRPIESKLRAARNEQTAADILDAVYEEMQIICGPTLGAPLLRLWLGAYASRLLTRINEPDLRAYGRNLLSEKEVAATDKTEIAIGLLSKGNKLEDAASLAAVVHLRRANHDPNLLRFLSQVLSRGEGHARTGFALDWLERNCDTPEAGEVLARGLSAGASARLVDLGYAYVDRFLKVPVSGPVLWSLGSLPRKKRFFDLLDRWLRTSANPDTAVAIYSQQLQTVHRQRYVRRAMIFMSKQLDINGGHDVLAKLVRCRPGDIEVSALVRRWLDENVGSNQATPILVEMVQCEPLDAADLGRALRHIDMGAPGSGYLFSVIATTLQNADHANQHALRIGLSQGDAIVFSQALRWKAVR